MLLFGGEGQSGLVAARLRAEVRRLVTEILARRGRGVAFGDDDGLAEIGISSMDMVALVLALESRFDIEIPRRDMTAAQFASVACVAALLARLDARVQSGCDGHVGD